MSEKCNADEDFKEKETNDPSGHESESLADEISKLTIQNEGKANEIEKVGEKKEASSAVKEFARWIQEEECCNILVLTGAGVSVAAGIPDFRTPGTGLVCRYSLFYNVLTRQHSTITCKSTICLFQKLCLTLVSTGGHRHLFAP